MAAHSLAFVVFSLWCSTLSLAARLQANFSGALSTTSGEKDIVYIRHGKSAGNAMSSFKGFFKVLAEKGTPMAYKDGQLMKAGELQAADRVSLMNEDLLKSINDVQLIMVSPLARALATAVIVVANARYRHLLLTTCKAQHDCVGQQLAAQNYVWPKIEVVVELREKVKSDSEVIGSGSDARVYIESICEEMGQALFGFAGALNTIKNDIVSSYDGYDGEWGIEPGDTVQYIHQINEFKERLANKEESKVLLVGHSGWARFAFGAFLPNVGDEDAHQNLMQAQRQVHPLNNCGVLQAKFNRNEDRLFREVVVDKLYPGSMAFPNLESDEEGKEGVITNIAEAVNQGVVPQGSMLAFQMLKKVSKYIGTKKTRYFTFTARNGVEAYLAWAAKWGKPKNYISIKQGDATFQRKSKTEISITPLVISSKSSKKHSTFTVAGSDSEVEAFWNKLNQFQEAAR